MAVALSENAVNLLNWINGADLFDATSASMGYIERHEYLQIPGSLRDRLADVHVFTVQDVWDRPRPLLTRDQLVVLAAANLVSFGNNPQAPMLALFRAMLVSNRMLISHLNERAVGVDEVVWDAPEPEEATRNIIVNWMNANLTKVRELGTATAVVPTWVSHTFISMGHHWISDQQYETSYNQLISASALGLTISFEPKEAWFRTAVHPFGVRQFTMWHINASKHAKVPEAMMLRVGAAPAGTALLGSSLAVIDMMRPFHIYKVMETLYRPQMDQLERVVERIRTPAHRLQYSKDARLFGVAPLDPADRDAFREAKEFCTMLAPRLEGFCRTIGQRSPLARIRVLKKPAESQAAVLAISIGYFKALQKGLTKTVDSESLFGGSTRQLFSEAINAPIGSIVRNMAVTELSAQVRASPETFIPNFATLTDEEKVTAITNVITTTLPAPKGIKGIGKIEEEV